MEARFAFPVADRGVILMRLKRRESGSRALGPDLVTNGRTANLCRVAMDTRIRTASPMLAAASTTVHFNHGRRAR